jgi:hypothetical protein
MAVRSLKNSTIENFANYSSSMNAGYSFQDYELIESVFVASNTASVSFNNLDQYATEYKHLQLRATGRSTRADADSYAYIRFNSDSGANYSSHRLRGSGTDIASDNFTSAYPSGIIDSGLLVGANGTSGAFGSSVFDIIDAYNTAKNTTTRSLSGMTISGYNRIVLGSGSWRNTSSLTSISISDVFASIAAGSRFSLYGIR